DEDRRRDAVRAPRVHVSGCLRGRIWGGGGTAVRVYERPAGDSRARGLPARRGYRALCGRRAAGGQLLDSATHSYYLAANTETAKGRDPHHRRPALRIALGRGFSAGDPGRVARCAASPN